MKEKLLIVVAAALILVSASWKNTVIQKSTADPAEMAACSQEYFSALNEFELAINLELARFEGKALRPFVAIWVENEASETVRTLSLWFNDYKWLPDLRRWYTKNFERTRAAGKIDAVTGATRPAGKYTIIWDGKDDQGMLLNKGIYTVFIEVVRERGTYQLIRQPVEMNDIPKLYELTPGVEVSSASIEYRKTVKPETGSR